MFRQCSFLNLILLTKTTATQNGVALSYHKMRRLYFLAVVVVKSIVYIFWKVQGRYIYITSNYNLNRNRSLFTHPLKFMLDLDKWYFFLPAILNLSFLIFPSFVAYLSFLSFFSICLSFPKRFISLYLTLSVCLSLSVCVIALLSVCLSSNWWETLQVCKYHMWKC